MTINTPYCAITFDGLFIQQDTLTSRLFYGVNPVVAPNGIDAAMFVVAALASDGKHYAAYKSHSPGNCILQCEDGRFQDFGPTYGNQCVVLKALGPSLLLGIQTGLATAQVLTVDPASLLIRGVLDVPIPQTSQGFTDFDVNNELILCDEASNTIDGQPVNYLTALIDGIQIGQAGLAGQTLMFLRGKAGTLNVGYCYEPRRAGNFWCCRGQGSTLYHGSLPSSLPPIVVTPAPPISVPVFAPNPVLALVLPDDLAGAKRFTYFNDPTTSAALDRGYYAEKDANTTNWDAQIAQGLARGRAGNLPLVIDAEVDVDATWADAARRCTAAGVYHVPSLEMPPTVGDPAVYLAKELPFTKPVRSIGVNVWLYATTDGGAWTVQDVIDFNWTAWNAILAAGALVYSVSIFMRANEDPAFAQMIAAMQGAAKGRDPFPLPVLPVPSPNPPSLLNPFPLEVRRMILVSDTLYPADQVLPHPTMPGQFCVKLPPGTNPTVGQDAYLSILANTDGTANVTWHQEPLNMEAFTWSGKAGGTLIADRRGTGPNQHPRGYYGVAVG